jgi:NADPH:quinone reductase-like Zn-dependent oxidoreductase
MKYKNVIVPERGGPEVLQIVENELHAPPPGQARIKILVTPVCQDDVAARVGNRPFLPKLPFVPGYSILGTVDAIGDGVSQVAVGDRVAALTQTGGYSEIIYLDEQKLVHVPEAVDPAEAAILILNYVVPYQVMHRTVQVQAGDKVLIIGASGGVGTAFLQLGQVAQLKMYGLASARKHGALSELGAIPIDYRTQDFVEVIQEAEPDGLDYVFNGMADEYIERCLANSKAVKGYGTHRVDISLLKEDWLALFNLLEQGQIKPIIADRFPLAEAAKANALLESGQVTGNLVLMAPELLEA